MYETYNLTEPYSAQLSEQGNSWLRMPESVQSFRDSTTTTINLASATNSVNSPNLAPPLPSQFEPRLEEIDFSSSIFDQPTSELREKFADQSEPKLGEIRDLSEVAPTKFALQDQAASFADPFFAPSDQDTFAEQFDEPRHAENLFTDTFDEAAHPDLDPSIESSETFEPSENLSQDQIAVLKILEQINQEHDRYQPSDREQHHELDQLTEIFTQVSARLTNPDNQNSVPELLEQLAQQYIQQAEQSPSAPTERENLQKAELCLEQRNQYSDDKDSEA